MNQTLTSLTGIKVGHSTHIENLTGCTFVSFGRSLPVAYKAYGGAPGTFNTDMLQNGMTFSRRWGLFIAGGSLTGLMCASEIMKRMIENKMGSYDASIYNPSISGAIVFDLGTHLRQFDPIYGQEAFDNLSDSPVLRGNVGAGTGVSVGKFQNLEKGSKRGGMKAGVGCARIDLGGGIIVTALSVVNAIGNVINPDGSILAGNRDESKKFKLFDDTTEFVTQTSTNTTITIVGINVDLKTRENYERVAHVASHGQVRSINPVHTSLDGDTVFVFSTEEIKKPLNSMGAYFEDENWPLFTVDLIGQAAAKAVQMSIYDSCEQAESVHFEKAYKGIVPSVKDFK